LRLLFADEIASFDGRWARFRDLRLDPGPVQDGGPPIWIGGRGRRAMRRAGRFGAIWAPYMYTPEILRQSLRVVRDEASSAGRDSGAIGGAIHTFVCVAEEGDRAKAEVAAAVGRTYAQDFRRLRKYLVAGTPDEVLERLEEFSAAGAESALLRIAWGDDRREDVYRLLAEAILPKAKAFRC
jgi:alkanesulfonate monooxygenase SsuD/methylene tetrahydromethanopterin reductase-like flavin-dependent oxidoreductase (luciferase family)